MGPATQPLILTHAIHGAVVNFGWRCMTGFVSAQLTILEGFMRSTVPGVPIDTPNAITQTNTIQSVTQQIPPSVIPPFEYIPPEPVEIPDKYKPWIPSEDVPPGTYRLIQRLHHPNEYRTPTRDEERLAAQYGWEFINIHSDGFFAVKKDTRIRY